MFGEYADMARDSDLNAFIDEAFGVDFVNDDDDSVFETNIVNVSPFKPNPISPYIHDIEIVNRITKDNQYLLRRISGGLNLIVKCIRVTEKAILFQSDDEGYPKVLGNQFWLPKSIIQVEKNRLPKCETYYIPKWSDIKILK